LGGDTGAAGGEIEVYGSAHASAANQIRFVNNGTLGGLISSASAWTIGASGSTQTHSINGNFTSINASAGDIAWSFRKDVNAGDSTNTAQLAVGNSGTNQGQSRLAYVNAAATGAPSSSFAFDPRNNADTTNFNAARLLFSKVAAADTATAEIQTAVAGTFASRISIGSTGAVTLGSSGTSVVHNINTDTSTTVGAAGAGEALPATPDGYIKLQINGVEKYIPIYAPG
jgi:hypothetical protein